MYVDFMAQRLQMKHALKAAIIEVLGPNYQKLDDATKYKIREAVHNTTHNFIKPTRRRNIINTLAGDIVTGLNLDNLRIRKDDKQ